MNPVDPRAATATAITKVMLVFADALEKSSTGMKIIMWIVLGKDRGNMHVCAFVTYCLLKRYRKWVSHWRFPSFEDHGTVRRSGSADLRTHEEVIKAKLAAKRSKSAGMSHGMSENRVPQKFDAPSWSVSICASRGTVCTYAAMSATHKMMAYQPISLEDVNQPTNHC